MVLNELTSRKALVLATGGGAITQAPNREFLKQRGIVIYLYTPVELQLQRTYRDKNRPLLQVENPEQKLRDLLKIRDPCIEKLHIIRLKQIKVLHVISHKDFATYSSEQVKIDELTSGFINSCKLYMLN